MYRVIRSFADLTDHEHIYRTGDVYPRPEAKVSEERINELLSGRNKIGQPLIEKIDTPVTHEKAEETYLPFWDEEVTTEEVEKPNRRSTKRSEGKADEAKPKRSRKKNV